MKLYHPVFMNPIKIEESEINVIVIENSNVFYSMISQLKNQIEGFDGEFILSNSCEEISVQKSMDLIINLFSLDINCKKVINRLYDQISKLAVSEDFYLKTEEIRNLVSVYISNLAYEFKQDICYNDQFDLKSILKMTEVKFFDDYENIVEKIIDYMDIINEYCGINTFVFVNLKTFLSKEEIDNVYSYAVYNKVNIILFENNIIKKRGDIERYTIIDDDLCVL